MIITSDQVLTSFVILKNTVLMKPMTVGRWDAHWLRMAHCMSLQSKDPSTKIGSLIVNEDKDVVSTGYNGFPKGMNDDEKKYKDRDFKYKHIIHAEINALLKARERVEGCSIYTWGLYPCIRCAVCIAQSGITKVVSFVSEDYSRWENDLRESSKVFDECGVEYIFLAPKNNT